MRVGAANVGVWVAPALIMTESSHTPMPGWAFDDTVDLNICVSASCARIASRSMGKMPEKAGTRL
jgi:hypothetical protein